MYILTMSKVSNYIAILLVLCCQSCLLPNTSTKENGATDLSDSNATIIDSISIDLLTANSFQLLKEEPFFFAIDSNRIIATYHRNEGNEPVYIYLMNPRTKTRYDSIFLDKYWDPAGLTYHTFFNRDKMRFLTNNRGEFRLLLHEEDTYGDIYTFTNLKTKKTAIKYKMKPKDPPVIPVYIDSVFHNSNGVCLINDSVVDFYSEYHPNVTAIHPGQQVYQINKTGIQINNGPNFPDGPFSPVNLFPVYNKLFFRIRTGKFNSVISYDLKVKASKRYIFPVEVFGVWPASNCIYFSYNENDKSRSGRGFVRYSYIPY
jgi:hypothetical protein